MKSQNKITNRNINKKNILMLIKHYEPISRVDISRMLNISRPSVISYVNELIEEGLVVEIGLKPSTSRGGKRARLLEFNRIFKYILSVHISEGKLDIAVLDLNFSIIKKKNSKYKLDYRPEKLINRIISEISNIMKSLQLGKKDFIGLGVSSLGVVDRERGIINYSKLLGWSHINIREILRDRLDMDVYIDNECRLYTLAENLIGSGKNIKRLVCMKISKGIGSGIIINNKILRDRNGIVGEIGHTTINYDSKIKCSCGNYGCLETLCSIEALINNIKKELKDSDQRSCLRKTDDLDLNKICNAFRNGDELVSKIVFDNAKKSSIGISNIIKFFNPSLIILYGQIECFGEEYLKIVRKYVKKETFPTFTGNDYNIIFSKFGEDYNLIGASILVFNNFFNLEENYFIDKFIVK